MKLLLEAGADPKARSTDGRSRLGSGPRPLRARDPRAAPEGSASRRGPPEGGAPQSALRHGTKDLGGGKTRRRSPAGRRRGPQRKPRAAGASHLAERGGSPPCRPPSARLALSLPEVREDHPWGHSAFKVKEKAFLFMATEQGELSLSMKLPQSGLLALSLPFAEPTGYGLGKSGWVTARFPASGRPPLPVLAEWVEESYRTIAPKKLLARLTRAVVPDDRLGRSPRVPTAHERVVDETAQHAADERAHDGHPPPAAARPGTRRCPSPPGR